MTLSSTKTWKLMQVVGGVFFFIGFSGCIGYLLQGRAPDHDTSIVMVWTICGGAVLWAIGKTGRWWLRE